MFSLALLLLFPFIMVFAAASDLLTMRISNYVSIALVVLYLVVALVSGLPLMTIAYHLACGVAVLIVTFSLFAMGWIGGGDAKLAAATAIWAGWANILPYLAFGAVFGGLLTIVLLAYRFIPLPIFLVKQDWARRLHDRKAGIPYGIALAAAGLVIYRDTPVWEALAQRL